MVHRPTTSLFPLGSLARRALSWCRSVCHYLVTIAFSHIIRPLWGLPSVTSPTSGSARTDTVLQQVAESNLCRCADDIEYLWVDVA